MKNKFGIRNEVESFTRDKEKVARRIPDGLFYIEEKRIEIFFVDGKLVVLENHGFRFSAGGGK